MKEPKTALRYPDTQIFNPVLFLCGSSNNANQHHFRPGLYQTSRACLLSDGYLFDTVFYAA